MVVLILVEISVLENMVCIFYQNAIFTKKKNRFGLGQDDYWIKTLNNLVLNFRVFVKRNK